MNYHTIIIGGGQAGLAAAYYLSKQNKNYVVLEAADTIGHSWKVRYDSLKLFTSARYNNLPGLEFPGAKNRFPHKDEVVSYLQNYVNRFQIQLKINEKVISLSKKDQLFQVRTENNSYTSENVIVSTGPFQEALIPAFIKNIDADIHQMHSSTYRNSTQLQAGDTLVVGGGNSGVQIVEELVNEGRNVYFSFRGKMKRMPNNMFMQRLVFGSGITSAAVHSLVGGLLKKRGEPVMGTNIKKLFREPNLTLVGRTIGADTKEIMCEEGMLLNIRNIIWATGFNPDFRWMAFDIFDEKGYPVQQRGVTSVSGLYFLGLAWMHSRNSGLLGGIKEDAEYITDKIAKN